MISTTKKYKILEIITNFNFITRKKDTRKRTPKWIVNAHV